MNQFENIVQPFCNITKVPVTFFEPNGQVQWECFSDEKICRFMQSDQNYLSICKRTLLSSIRTAAQLGEPYIFRCPSGLMEIAVALILQGKIRGYFIAGPIAMGNNKEMIIKNLLKNITLPPDIYPGLAMFISDMKVFTPKEVGYLASLFNSTILCSINSVEAYKKINENYKEQIFVGEQIQKYKKQKKQLDYPYELERELINKVKNGDRKGAHSTLIDLLDKISLIESGDLSFIKIRALGICTILTRISTKQEISFQISSQEIENMDLLNKVESFKDLCQLTTKICENVCRNITSQSYTGNSSIIINACNYIDKNYMNKITLKDIADELYTNLSYLSTLFKKEMGIGFTEYVNDIRLKRAQDLLINSNKSLLDISLCVGFDCQSYFTKVFKKKNGITPSEYRKMNQPHTIS